MRGEREEGKGGREGERGREREREGGREKEGGKEREREEERRERRIVGGSGEGRGKREERDGGEQGEERKKRREERDGEHLEDETNQDVVPITDMELPRISCVRAVSRSDRTPFRKTVLMWNKS